MAGKINDRQLDDWLSNYLEYTDNTEPPVLFREWCGISAIAAMLQRKCWLDWGTVMFYPNMYIVLVSPPGKARKGTAIAPMKKFLEDAGIAMSAESVTREAVIQNLSECNDVLNHEEDDGTMRVISHSSLTILSPELTVFLGNNNYALLSALTDWFDCANKWVYRTKNVGTNDIRGVYINLLGATTPDLIRSSLPLDAIGGGLTSRIVFVYEEKKGKIVPYPFLDDPGKKLEASLVYDLERIRMMSGRFKVTQEFLKAWGDWYISNDGRSPFGTVGVKAFDGYIERRPTQILKLCMILNASRTSTMMIDECDLVRAVKLLERTEVKMPKTFGGVGESKYASLTNSIISEIGITGECSLTHLLQKFLYDGTREEIVAILQALEKNKLAIMRLKNKDRYYSLAEVPKGGV